MTSLKEALYIFWSQFGIPAYLDDQVPDDAELPYTKYGVSMSDVNGFSLQTAFLWCADEKPYGNVWRTEMMDQIQKAIPHKGVIIAIDDGYVILRRNETDFLRDWQDPNDKSVIGVRCAYTLQHYYL